MYYQHFQDSELKKYDQNESLEKERYPHQLISYKIYEKVFLKCLSFLDSNKILENYNFLKSLNMENKIQNTLYFASHINNKIFSLGILHQMKKEKKQNHIL